MKYPILVKIFFTDQSTKMASSEVGSGRCGQAIVQLEDLDDPSLYTMHYIYICLNLLGNMVN